MSITTTQNLTVSSQRGQSVGGSVTEVGATEINIDQTYPGSSTNVAMDITFTIAGLQSFILVASQDTTVKTNSTGSPGNTWSLKANIPFVWSKSAGYFTNPVSADVTKFYVTTTAASRLQGKILVS